MPWFEPFELTFQKFLLIFRTAIMSNHQVCYRPLPWFIVVHGPHHSAPCCNTDSETFGGKQPLVSE